VPICGPPTRIQARARPGPCFVPRRFLPLDQLCNVEYISSRLWVTTWSSDAQSMQPHSKTRQADLPTMAVEVTILRNLPRCSPRRSGMLPPDPSVHCVFHETPCALPDPPPASPCTLLFGHRAHEIMHHQLLILQYERGTASVLRLVLLHLPASSSGATASDSPANSFFGWLASGRPSTVSYRSLRRSCFTTSPRPVRRVPFAYGELHNLFLSSRAQRASECPAPTGVVAYHWPRGCGLNSHAAFVTAPTIISPRQGVTSHTPALWASKTAQASFYAISRRRAWTDRVTERHGLICLVPLLLTLFDARGRHWSPNDWAASSLCWRTHSDLSH
jgi:hypothetical protein